MARDIVLILLGLRRLEHVALAHTGWHHHLRAQSSNSMALGHIGNMQIDSGAGSLRGATSRQAP